MILIQHMFIIEAIISVVYWTAFRIWGGPNIGNPSKYNTFFYSTTSVQSMLRQNPDYIQCQEETLWTGCTADVLICHRQHVLIPGHRIPRFCHVPLATHPDAQGLCFFG